MTNKVRAEGIKLKFQVKNHDFQLAINTTLPGKGVTAIFGPSGSGKTTLLRCIAGLTKAEHGELVVNGEDWQKQNAQKKHRFIPVHKRDLSYVFQEASLFAHLNVEDNIRYGIKRRKTNISAEEYQQILNMLDIEALLYRLPDKLSGGERQRVAIARALVTKPALLLMDEPLSSLDDARKQQILPYLEELKNHADIPILYVTHSMQEVTRLADHVLLLQNGKVAVQGGINQVFSQQICNDGELTGTVINVTATEKDEKWHLMCFSFDNHHLWLADSGEALHQEYRVRIPASDVSISLEGDSKSSILNRLKAQISHIKPCDNQARCLVYLNIGNQSLVAQITQKSASELELVPDMPVWVQIKSAAIIR